MAQARPSNVEPGATERVAVLRRFEWRIPFMPEAQQISRDIRRILQREAGLDEYLDPLADSNVIESLADRIELETRAELMRISEIGRPVAAIENGYYK
jgi:methylmalonyl-CoA mutase N-terminal domain/subunit